MYTCLILDICQVERCKELWRRLQAFYKNRKVESKLDNLTLLMIQKQKSAPPKLRAKAAELRCLIPFIQDMALEFFDDGDAKENCAKQLVVLLNGCYSALSSDVVFAADLLADRCRKMCVLWVALESRSDPPLWRVKPKMHLFQELAGMQVGDRPALSWTYRDEDFGASLAQRARVRGGHHTPKAVGQAVLLKFIAKHTLPRVA